MMSLRQRLITSDVSNLSSTSRSGLVLVLELFLLGWPKKLSDPVEAFYSKCLPQRGRCLQMQAQSNVGEDDDDGGDRVDSDAHTTTSAASSQDLFIGKSSMIEMNLAALAAQMSSLQQQEEDPMAQQIHGWETKDPEMWTPKTFSRPPPPIMNPSMNRPVHHGSITLNDYSNVHPSNLRR